MTKVYCWSPAIPLVDWARSLRENGDQTIVAFKAVVIARNDCQLLHIQLIVQSGIKMRDYDLFNQATSSSLQTWFGPFHPS